MDTVTYPDARIEQCLNTEVVPLRLNTADRDEKTRRMLRQFRTVWTPTFLALDHHGIEVRRWVGFLPPEAFLPQLSLARGSAALLHGEYDEALRLFRSAYEEFPASAGAPEGLYWAGVASYRGSGKAGGLQAQWTELQQKYPQSEWWTRAAFIAG